MVFVVTVDGGAPQGAKRHCYAEAVYNPAGALSVTLPPEATQIESLAPIIVRAALPDGSVIITGACIGRILPDVNHATVAGRHVATPGEAQRALAVYAMVPLFPTTTTVPPSSMSERELLPSTCAGQKRGAYGSEDSAVQDIQDIAGAAHVDRVARGGGGGDAIFASRNLG